MPAVSVIMPAYNAAQTISKAIDSVITQTYTDWELIICDDASTDSTVEVILHYLSNPKIQLICSSQNNGSAGRPRNQAINQASGKWIAFLDADDIWLPSKLEKQIRYLQTHPEVVLVHCDFRLLKKGKLVRSRYLPQRKQDVEGDLSQRIIWRNPIATPAVVLERTTLIKTGFFDESLSMGEDYDLWIRLAQQGPFGYLPEPLLIVKTHEGAGVFRSVENLQRVEKSLLEVSNRYTQNNTRAKHKSLARVYGIMGAIYLENQNKSVASVKLKQALRHAVAAFDPYTLLVLKLLFHANT